MERDNQKLRNLRKLTRPADMSLEEIEKRLGSLIQADTVSQLKSAVWKDRLKAISSFKEQVEAIQDLGQSVEILIRLLCAVPGWSEKNSQVQQQVVDIITHIASTASKFPKKCVVLCIVGISERVADSKTRAHAMKCLTTFCESVGPGFIFERMCKIMKEHRNPKVLSEGLLWMISAVEDFGISLLKLKDLVDFCKDTGLQSSAAATRNATIKLIGALHKFVGPDIKGFLSDVKPALLSALDAEYEKNPFEGVSAVPKKTVKAMESTSSLFGAELDSLPREDISGKITPTLLKSLESPDWKGSRPESIMSVQVITTIQSQALLNVKDSSKDNRERMAVHRFKFEEPSLEQIQDLENELMKYFREDLHTRLLSTDFKKQVDGIEMLQKALPSIGKDIGEVLDILLRWFVLRFCESNTLCLLKVLEFLPELFDTLRNEGYTMTESEAAIFLPCLIEKSGHNIIKVREKMRELTKQIIHTYSAAKTFPYVLEGLHSSNNQTQIESVDLVGYLLDNHGSEIGGQLISLQIVASLAAERDGETRKAALNTLAIGYKILGDDIWKYVGKLTEAQRSMLDDRFKWKAREMDKRNEEKPGEATTARSGFVRENGSEVAEQGGEVSRAMSGPIFSRENYGHSELDMEIPPIPQSLACAIGPTGWNEALDIIAYGSLEQSVDGMKVVRQLMAQATSDPEVSAMDYIVKDSDELVTNLAYKVAKTIDFSLTGASSRACKYVLNTLLEMFNKKMLAHAVKESSLDGLITELLVCILDERLLRMDDGSQILKALNVLMLKILDNAERTSSFVVLINHLHPVDPSRWPSQASNESSAARFHEFSDLVVKCLIKLTKVLQNTIYDVDLDRILQSIHVFLEGLGWEEIGKRAGTNDRPLRTVKTLLLELVKLCGTSIKGHLSMVPTDMEPRPIILAYIDLDLEESHWGD